MYKEIDGSVIKFFAWLASKRYGGSDGIFNSANFSNVASELLGLPTLDGIVVELVLSGREGIKKLNNAYWQISR